MNNVIVLSGPSGAGKTSQQRLLVERLGFVSSVSVTTRQPRNSLDTGEPERDGIDYYFVSCPFFDLLTREEFFIEHAGVYDNRYGIPAGPILCAIKTNSRIVLNIDVKGFATLKNHPDKRVSNAVRGVFLMPPSISVLEQRLRARDGGRISEVVIQKRLAEAPAEMQSSNEFDRVVVTHDRESSFEQIKNFVENVS